jgi:hypothetical protein
LTGFMRRSRMVPLSLFRKIHKKVVDNTHTLFGRKKEFSHMRRVRESNPGKKKKFFPAYAPSEIRTPDLSPRNFFHARDRKAVTRKNLSALRDKRDSKTVLTVPLLWDFQWKISSIDFAVLHVFSMT